MHLVGFIIRSFHFGTFCSSQCVFVCVWCVCVCVNSTLNVEVKATIEQATKVQKRSRGISLLFL